MSGKSLEIVGESFMFCCNRFFNLNTCCVPQCETQCGPKVTVTCNNCCARVCSQVTYTVTITNTESCTINCASLHIRVPRSFCFNQGSLTVNGNTQENGCPDCVNIGTIRPSQTITVRYRVTIMECKRYNHTQAVLQGLVCCCCENKHLCIPSNVNCLQVCCCCCGGSSMGDSQETPTETPETPENNDTNAEA